MTTDVETRTAQRIFDVVLIRPTRYDDRGYPLQWTQSLLPSNSLACVHGLAEDCRQRRVLGDDVDIRVTVLEETNTIVDAKALIAEFQRHGGGAFVGIVGVQTNQFPRAVDISRAFRAADIPVCIGGFHVSGSLSMLDEHPPEIVEVLEMGISLFVGEAENGRFEEVLRDAAAGRLKPIYDHLDELPDLRGQPIPSLPPQSVALNNLLYSCFDLGRGCPFKCAFCCIINVQGNKSRYRTADDLEEIIRFNAQHGIHRFFITDDDFARNRNWEACFDRMIEIQERDGVRLRFTIQVDTRSYKIPGFIEKAAKAGVDHVFMGLESINSDDLAAIDKKQNRIDDYREMLLKWKRHAIVVSCGYITGLPNETRESIIRDIEILKRELPLDALFITYLTPLPGSVNHKRHIESGQWLDPDFNKYDLSHRVIHHPRMSDEEWEDAYHEVHRRFYSMSHMITVLKRAAAVDSDKKLTTAGALAMYGVLLGKRTGSMEGGYWRRMVRTDRRPGLPLEPRWVFYPRAFVSQVYSLIRYVATEHWLRFRARRIWASPRRYEYTDAAIAPIMTARRTPVGEARSSSPRFEPSPLHQAAPPAE